MLDDAQKDRLMRLFAAGAELPMGERQGFVARECADDPALRRELAELLEIESARLADFLTAPAIAAVVDPVTAQGQIQAPAQSPRQLPEIDGYTGFERIAEGGMGTVYRAQQLRPVRREVAIKLIRSGMVTETVLARFEAERQALAMINHPYIATVYDAGTDATGRPFLTMEFVRGVPITDYCERENLSLEDRLRLFLKVCGAVDHAHRRGVLHRDLKPSNVLVARVGEEAMPKVIDFGIAKALAGPLGERAIHTLEGTFLGTPDYMAPEQIEGAVHQIDTRSDVYALGVVLYELVTSRRPIETSVAPSNNFVQWIRVVRDTLPKKPSTRLQELMASRGDRKSTPLDRASWIKRLAGDLDWVIMKALEKEPDRRYGSPRELALDLERFLEHAPVSAGPPSGLYAMRRLARRYRVQVAAGGLVLLSLVLGLSGTLWFLVQSKASEAAAVQRARQAEGVRIAAEAALAAKSEPNRALLLALTASRLTDDSAVRQSVYDALPYHAMRQRLIGEDQGIDQGGGVLLRYLSDGRLLGSGASDAVLWDPETGEQLRRFAGPRQSLAALVIDQGERLLLGASWDGRAYLWDLETGATLRVVGDPTGELSSCAFSPDGSRFATSSLDGTARVYATRDMGPPLVLQHERAVAAVAFDASGTQLVTTAADRRTRIWNLATGALELECAPGVRGDAIGDPELRGAELFLCPGVERIVSVCGGTILVHTTGGALVLELEAGYPRRYGEDRLLASIDGTLVAVDLRSGNVERHAELRLWSATPTPDLCFAVAIDHKWDVCLLDLSSMQVVRHYLGPADKGYRPPMAFDPSGRRFAVLAPDVRIWNLEPEYAPFDVPNAAPASSRISPAWGRAPIAVVRAADSARWEVWDAAARRRLCEVRWPDVDFLEPSPCGTKLIAGVPGDGAPGWRIVVLGLDGRSLREIQLPARPVGSPGARTRLHRAIDRTGRLLVTVQDDAGTVDVDGVLMQCHDLGTGELLGEIENPRGVPTWCGPPDSGLVAMVGWQQRFIEVLDWRTGEVRARISRPPDGMHLEAAVSPDGRYLLGTLGEPLAFVWDLERADEDPSAHPIAAYTGLIPAGGYPCGFLAKGRLCWVICNHEVHLFETSTGNVFAVLRLPDACAHIAESPDGTEIVTQTASGRVQRFPLDPLATARRLAVGELDSKERAQYRVGMPDERLAAERAFLAARLSPGNCAKLGKLALAAGDLDEAISCYQRGADLGVLGPYYDYLYLDLVGLYCQRLAAGSGDAEQRRADRDSALAALERALWCGVTRERAMALPGIEHLVGLRRFGELVGR